MGLKEISTEREAHQFRKKNELENDTPINFRSLIQKLGVVLVSKNLSNDFSGMAMKTGDHRFIMINSRHPFSRQRFTIAHELYHLYVQKDFTFKVCSTELFEARKDKEEYNADSFAADLLLPRFGLIELIPNSQNRLNTITLDTLLSIEQYFQCSRTALLFRLKQMKFIDSSYYEKYSSNVRKSAKERGFSTKLYDPTHEDWVLSDYGLKARTLFENDLISEQHYSNLMLDINIDINKTEDELSV